MDDLGQQETRDWQAVRGAAIDAVSALGVPDAGTVADAVLAICDEEAVNRTAAEFVEETRLRSMDFRNGAKMDLEPSRTLVANWIGAARGMIGEASNYVEMEVSLAGEAEGYVFRLERREGKTPHQLRQEAEAAQAAQRERYEHLLGDIWLYIDWRWVTRQLTTGQKELWADAIDAVHARADAEEPEIGLYPVERWWRDDA